MREILSRARALHEWIVVWRCDIYRHPGLGFDEHRTTALVADALHAMGLWVETGVGTHLGHGRPAVGLRAEMDALQIQEANQVPTPPAGRG